MSDIEKEKFDRLRSSAWEKSLNAFGYGYIFDLRSAFYGRWSNWLKVLGIIVPVSVGAIATGYGLDSMILKWSIVISIPASIIQLIVSVIAVVYKWDDELAYSIESSQELGLLSDQFKKLGEFPPNDLSELENKYDLLNERYNSRIKQNTKHGIKEDELRKGMRYALRQYQRRCAGCGVVPISMSPTDCDVCGNF